ncbi:cytochrome c oxidase assembly protein subunit 15 [Cohaesibacter sp. ES.047]|uniref:COX15/CtaA family protein n=1 Tax=Cohaesibacter sp. ES.047 TaxID=1798205 RepID=UPI000BB932C6|nr:COX15/CtaA family protein [Cohaesibacter sp. ES.047]SNY93113.1 cytochrome c oxidase assembly protein subunit 15 [Cohaesibacter sp. ES.047]
MDEQISAAERASRYVDRAPSKVGRARPVVRNWLYFVAFLVLLMVVVGGATRLTDSGLSITEWKPIHGAIPPMSAAEWTEEFQKYRQYPEYQRVNKGMSLDEFKFIFWWEWGHRQLGRFIGVAFFVPMLFFWLTGRLSDGIKPGLLVLLGLGALQGGVGWWMVASGLVDRVDVSQYRLATHLTFAAVIFVMLIWVARGYRRADRMPECVSADRHILPASILLLLLLMQIFLGGLVAGTHAGMTYNTWPLMDGQLIPDGLFVFDPPWLAAFEDRMTIQFNHRILAYVIALWTLFIWVRTWRDPYAAQMTIAATVVGVLVALQIIIGIVTLLLVVPLHAAMTHQALAVILLGVTTIKVRDLYDNAVRF